MSILGLGAKVIVEYKADVSGMKAGLKEMSAEERKVHEQRIKHAEIENKRLDRQIKNLGLMAAGIAATAVAVAAAKRGLDAYAKTSEVAAAEVDKFKNNVGKAFETMEVAIGRVVMALAPLIEGLAKVAEFAAGGLGDLAMIATGDMEGLYRKHGITRDRQTGEQYLSNARDIYVRNAGGDSNPYLAMKAGAEFDRQQKLNEERDARNRASNAALAHSMLDAAGTLRDGLNAVGGFVRGRLNDPWAGKAKGGKGGPARSGPYGDYIGGVSFDYDFENTGSTSLGSAADSVSRDEFGREIGLDTMGPYQKLLDERNAQLAANRAKTESFLESTFGPVGEFDIYASAFQTLSGAVGSAMTAWIDGSMSAGKAFKMFIAEAVKGLAVQMAMESLKHGAYALGHLASEDYVGAAKHGKAAAAFAGGAVIAAAAAKALHSGGGGASVPGGGGAGSYAGTGGGSGSGASNGGPIIVYGDNYADDSPRNRQIRARKLVNQAIGSGAVSYR